MCLIISIVSLVLTYNFYITGNHLGALLTLLVSIFFIALMIKNIKDVQRLKDEQKKKGTQDDN